MFTLGLTREPNSFPLYPHPAYITKPPPSRLTSSLTLPIADLMPARQFSWFLNELSLILHKAFSLTILLRCAFLVLRELSFILWGLNFSCSHNLKYVLIILFCFILFCPSFYQKLSSFELTYCLLPSREYNVGLSSSSP